MNPRKEIFNNIADEWDNMLTLTDEQRKTIKDVIDNSEVKSASYILDVGCGTGILEPYLLGKIGKSGKIWGIDVSDKMIEIAKNKFDDARAQFIADDIYEYPFEENTFDNIFVFSTFPHLHDKKTALEIFYNILKDRGQLTIFHIKSSEEINLFHSTRVRNEVLKKDYLPNLEEMQSLINKSKWKIASMEDKSGVYLISLQKNL